MDVTYVAVAVIATMVVLWIGIPILANVETSMPALTPGSYAENAFNKVQSTGWNAYQLLPIVLLILVAASILGVLGGFGRGA
jgi:hypothetical protein